MPIELQLNQHRDYLLRFARLQLRNDAWAEDAVSDTLLAALAKPQSFENKSQLKTWLVGILKHKVVDILRVQTSTWSGGQNATFNPSENLQSQQFFQILEACTDKLPAAQGRLFLMREWLEMSVEEICKELNLTSTNLYVQLHRARLRLRECLELNWFGNQSNSAAK